ncbi:MAG TPA: YdcF family protein [Kiloniellaceae bacterium]
MLYFIAKTLVLPPTCFFVLLLAALLLRRWSRRLGRWLLWSLLLVVYASTTPFVAIALIAPLQPYPPVDPLQPDDDVDAIVVLGAGIYYWAPEYRVPEDDPLSGLRAGSLTLQRLQYAAYLARLTGKPILASGGPASAAPYMTVAEAMKVTLERDFGVPVRWIENQSRSTYANAELSAQRLRNAGVQRFYLVSHAWHMPRAMLSFEAAGLEPIPAPTRFLLPGPLIWRDFLPTVGAMNVTYYAVHEWLGLAWYRLRAD